LHSLTLHDTSLTIISPPLNQSSIDTILTPLITLQVRGAPCALWQRQRKPTCDRPDAGAAARAHVSGRPGTHARQRSGELRHLPGRLRARRRPERAGVWSPVRILFYCSSFLFLFVMDDVSVSLVHLLMPACILWHGMTSNYHSPINHLSTQYSHSILPYRYHSVCIREWLKNVSNCPVCKKQVR
jgi:hypothetical protein